MPCQIALLRAVNVAGTAKLLMADLRSFIEALGFARARTYIQTGNVIFDTNGPGGLELEKYLEQQARARLGLETSFFVRTPDEWENMIEANPFADKARDDPRRLLVMALRDEPGAENLAALKDGHAGQEPIGLVGKHLYIDYLDGAGSSKLSNVLIERKLGTRGTARNWNTVLKIAELARA